MISERQVRIYCYEDPSLIENYELAIADTTQIWHLHHRVETIMHCGAEELIAKGCYENRPAHDLIFLTPSMHRSLHNIGNKYGVGHEVSAEHRAIISKTHTGKTVSDKTKMLLSINNGSHRQEVRDKISKTRIERKCGLGNKNAVGSKGHSGLRWITNGIDEKTVPVGSNPPSGYWFGRKRWSRKK